MMEGDLPNRQAYFCDIHRNSNCGGCLLPESFGSPDGMADPKAQANALKEQANALVSSKKYAKAMELYTAAIALDPTNHVLFSNRSGALVDLGRFPDAEIDARKCVSIAPSWVKGHYRLGVALENQAQQEEARDAYEAGLKLEPTHAELVKGMQRVSKVLEGAVAAPASGPTLIEVYRAAATVVDTAACAKEGVDVRAFARAFPSIAMLEDDAKGRKIVAACDIAEGTEIFTERCFAWYSGLGDNFGAAAPALLQTALWLKHSVEAVLLQLAPFAPTSAGTASGVEPDTLETHPSLRCMELVMRAARANVFGASWDEGSNTVNSQLCVFGAVAAIMNHSCSPNARFSASWDATSACPVLRVYALTSIAAGDEVCISYCNILERKEVRQATLKKYGFVCTCVRCAATWDDTRVLKCPTCTGPLFVGAPSCSACGVGVGDAAREDGPLERLHRGYLAKPRTLKELLADNPKEVVIHMTDCMRLNHLSKQLNATYALPVEEGIRACDTVLAAMETNWLLWSSTLPHAYLGAGYCASVGGRMDVAKARFAQSNAAFEVAAGAGDAGVALRRKLLESPPKSKEELMRLEAKRAAASNWCDLYGMPKKMGERFKAPLDGRALGILFAGLAPTPAEAGLVNELIKLTKSVAAGYWLHMGPAADSTAPQAPSQAGRVSDGAVEGAAGGAGVEAGAV